MKKVNKILFAMSLLVIANLSFGQEDECADATLITQNLTYCNYQAGSSANATQSMSTCSGGGNADDDVWYEFVATSSDVTIKVDPTVGYDAVIQLFSGTCGSLTSIKCQDVNGLNGAETLEATGLTIGNTYKFRVYHYGIGDGTSTFQVCVSGLASPTNNEPCSAFALPEVTPSCNYLNFTNAGSAGSSIAAPPVGSCGGSGTQQGGYTGGDVWFSVVVPASGQLDIHTQEIDFSDGAMALYSGTCASPVFVACDDDGEPGDGIIMPHIYATGLTPGETMFIRVWEYGNNNNGEFGICVTTPDNDDCANAQQICDLNGYGGVTSSAYTIDTPDNMCGIGAPSSPTPGCVFGDGYTGTSPVQIDNNSWLKFTAAATTAELFVEISSCQNGNGMQMQIFEGTNCTNFIPVSNFLETTSSQTIIASGLTIGATYYIVVDGFAGDICSYTISATSGVQVAEAVASEDIVCDGESTQLNGIVYGTGSYTYEWTEKDGTFISSSNPVTVSPTEPTEYILEINGYCGITTTASVFIDVNETPIAAAGSNFTMCDNETETITASATGGDGSYSYSWDNGLGNGNSHDVSPNSNTTYTVTVTDGNNCSDSDEIEVTVNPSPTAEAGTASPICFGQSANLLASGGGSYAWSPSGGSNAAASVSPTTTTTYTVTVTNGFNCADSDNVEVVVNDLPNAFAGNDFTVCNGGSANITATGGSSYFWSGGLGAGATHNLTNITSDVTYTVTVTDDNNCENTDQVSITVGAALQPDAGQDVSICDGESTTLSASGAVNYTWSNGHVGASQTVSPTETTTYILNADDGGSCAGVDQVTITVNANPVANAGDDISICQGDEVVISASGGVSYSWNNGLGAGADQTISPSTTTTYTVTVENAATCTDTDDIVVTVNSLPAIIASADETICEGESITISASGTGIVNYEWEDENGGTFSGQDQDVSPTETITYTVIGTDANDCEATASVTIDVNELPQIDISSMQVTDASCANGGGTVSGISVVGEPEFTYQWDNGVNVVGNTPVIGDLASGNYTLTVTDGNDCSQSTNITIGSIDLITVNANNDSTETEIITLVALNVYVNDSGDVATIEIVTPPNNGIVNYVGNGVFEYTPNQGFVGDDSFTYQICDVLCDQECDIATVKITVNGKGEIVVPNAFTPNGDGYNDNFVILNLDQYPNNSIVIFNRWGDKVFEAAPYNNDWDGSSENAKMVVSGNQVVEGTYYFVLDFGDKEKEPINGFIDLRRE